MLDLFEMVSGSRMMCNYMRPGGVSGDLPDGFLPAFAQGPRHQQEVRRRVRPLLSKNEIFLHARGRRGRLPTTEAVGLQHHRPVLRASGVAYDVRQGRALLHLRPLRSSTCPPSRRATCTRATNSGWQRCASRFASWNRPWRNSPRGRCRPKWPASSPPPESAYARIEAPKGELGFYLVSDGSTNPYRFHIRSSSLINLSALREMCLGLQGCGCRGQSWAVSTSPWPTWTADGPGSGEPQQLVADASRRTGMESINNIFVNIIELVRQLAADLSAHLGHAPGHRFRRDRGAAGFCHRHRAFPDADGAQSRGPHRRPYRTQPLGAVRSVPAHRRRHQDAYQRRHHAHVRRPLAVQSRAHAIMVPALLDLRRDPLRRRACIAHRSQHRHPVHRRPRVLLHVGHVDGRLGLRQQVRAAGQLPQRGATHQLRSADGPGDRQRGHDHRLDVHGPNRREPERAVHPHHADRFRDLPAVRRGRGRPLARSTCWRPTRRSSPATSSSTAA